MSRLRAVLAARSSHADVLAFKAAVDELSRLSCARAQDEALLRQLETQLLELEPEVAARLLTECQFRDEWREERCSRALSALPSTDADPEVVERMREYVALLAPPTAGGDEGDDIVMQGWQGELLRQQRALASLLTLCAGGSADRVQNVLTDFMEHSRARLHEQLATVHHYLLETAGNGGRADGRGSPIRSPQDGPMGKGRSPRHAWGSEEPAAKPTQAATPTVPGAFRGLSADEFVEQLRGKHRAVCSMQALARGHRQRRSFHRMVHERLGASVRLQCAARQGAARRAIITQRQRRWVVECSALTERHSARRLQRAWRWARSKHRWRTTWRVRQTAAARTEDASWRQLLRASLERRATTPTGFSQFSVYTESKVLAERREAEEGAALRLQACGRAAILRAEQRRLSRAACVLQAAARRRHAVLYDCWWRRALRSLHARRRARLRWRASRATALALQPLQTRAVLVQLHVGKELQHLRSEATREKAEFEEAFRKWAAKMERLTLAKKLHADWIPQMNIERGESYYFNVRTGESSEEHPNMKLVRATEKKQRHLGEEAIAERLARLRDYEEQLREGLNSQLESYTEASTAVMRDAAELSLPSAEARWVVR